MKNIEELCEMFLYTSLLGNNPVKKWKQDASSIINFICNSFGLTNISFFENIILEEVSNLCLISEYSGLRNEKDYDDEYSEIDIYYDLKGKTLCKIQGFYSFLLQYYGLPNEYLKYDSYFPYNPTEMFISTQDISGYGIPEINVHLGFLYALGIGVEKNLELALIKFKQASFWGNDNAIKYLAYTYKLLKDEKKNMAFLETYDLCSKYLHNGITRIPEFDDENYSDETRLYFAIISSIYNDIIIGRNKKCIDFAFLDVIFTNAISYSDKMKYIDEYDRNEWKSINVEYKKPNKDQFGFEIRKFGFKTN